jgi:hypothetical protein
MRLRVKILRVTGDRAGHIVDCFLQSASRNRARVVIDRTLCAPTVLLGSR